MAATVTHTPKAGARLTGAEYESATHHTVSITAADVGASATGHTHTHASTTGQTANDHHSQSHTPSDHTGTGSTSTQAFGDVASAGTGTLPANVDHKHGMPSERAASSTTPAAIGTAAVGTGTTDARSDHVHATGAGTPSTQAFGDAAATGTGPAAAMTDHKHAMPAHPVSFASPSVVLGTAAAAGVAGTVIRSDSTIAAFDATVPATQAFADAAATGSIAFAARRDHKHAMPTLGFGLTGNSAPAVSLTNSSAFATATTSVSLATYADVTGLSISLAAGTWLVLATVVGSSVNAQAIMHAAITDGANTIVAEGSQGIVASGSASVAQLGIIHLSAIVAPTGTTTYKVRAARGLTTITGTWTAMNGAGTNTTNNLTDGSNKGSGIFAVRIA